VSSKVDGRLGIYVQVGKGLLGVEYKMFGQKKVLEKGYI
jgi:hypothetical protein